MVIRCGIYEMLEYLKQVENKEYKRLVPQIMVAFYTGPKKWNVPVKLSDYFEMDTSKIKDEQTRYFIEDIQAMYKGDYIKLHQKRKMNTTNLIYAAIITGSLDMIKDIVEGDEMDMCEGMERMAEGFRSEGREEGILVGRNEGKLEEKQNTLLMQLRCKLGDLSKETENTIRSSTMEKLNKLTVSIFDIQSENDVLKLIH